MTEHAVEIDRYGGPEELHWREVEREPPGKGEIRIRTLFAAVNRADVEIRSGNWPIQQPDPFPYTPGLEVVGEVDAVGAAVDTVGTGDRVITMMQRLGSIHGERPGGYAEYVTGAADTVAILPPDADAEHLAALGLVAVTAAEGLRRLELRPSTRVVIHGVSGGVGSVAVAMAAARGAEVIAVLPPSTCVVAAWRPRPSTASACRMRPTPTVGWSTAGCQGVRCSSRRSSDGRRRRGAGSA